MRNSTGVDGKINDWNACDVSVVKSGNTFWEKLERENA